MTKQASPRCKALIAKWEGLAQVLPDGRVRSYPDPASPMGRGQYPKNGADVSKGKPWTIGFGTTGTDITRGTVWTLDKCERRFDEHLAYFAAAVNRLLARQPTAGTTDNQFAAMVALAYNIGLAAFEDSTLLRLHKAGDTVGAKGQFIRWNRAQGVVLKGLTNRRTEEAVLYGTT